MAKSFRNRQSQKLMSQKTFKFIPSFAKINVAKINVAKINGFRVYFLFHFLLFRSSEGVSDNPENV